MDKLALILLLVLVGHKCRCEDEEIMDEAMEDHPLDIIVADSIPGADKGVLHDEPAEDNTDRIVGGQETIIEEHPYQVSFVINDRSFCGGFIVSEDWIMTAAHCAQETDPSKIVLRAGSSYRRNGTVIPLAEVIPHPQYNQPHFDKDVAVMRTAEKITFNDVMQPIPLAPAGRPMRGGTRIVVSGWGRTRFGASTLPEQLMDVEIPVVNHMQCRLVYSSVLTYNQFCAGNFFLGGQGTCQGDSGGAAIQDGMAVGIVSYGRGCAQPLSPSVFADIASQPIRDFITEKTGL